jgi:ATP-binding cassette, subfamily B, bacterial MsbA
LSDGPVAEASLGEASAGKRRLASPKPLARLVPLLRPYFPRLAVCVVFLILAAGIGLYFPMQVKVLLDSAFQRHDRHQLDSVALFLIGLFAVQGALNFVQVYLLTGTSERVIAKLREALFAHLIRLSPAFFTERRTGELTSRLSSDLAVLQAFLNTNVSEMARQILFLVGGVVIMTRTHTTLTLTTLAVAPVIVGAAFFFGRMLRKASVGVQDRVASAMGAADEAFSQIRTVQGFVREQIETDRYADQLSDVVTAAIHRALLRALFFGVVGFIAFAGVVIVLWQGGRLVLAGLLTAGSLVQFLLYAITVAAAIGSLASLFGSYQEAVGAAKRVFELLEMEPSIAEPEDPEPLVRPVRGAVHFEDVWFRYTEDLPEVLHDVSLTIAPGEVVALVGPSGAGKTTVASLLPRFWDVTRGRITLDGHDVRRLSFADLRGSIGIVPQEPALFSGTVRENIAFARPDASESDVLAAARAAHAWEFIERLPEGLETRVGERGVKLSGGQRQRIAIARVFLKDPAIVVLDEATSSLDSESERLVEEAMVELLRGRSTLIIAHRLSTVRRADRVVVLDRGHIVEEGTHDALLAQEGTYAKLYRGQFRASPSPDARELVPGT